MRKTGGLLLLVLFPVFDILNNTNYLSPYLSETAVALSADTRDFIQKFDQKFEDRLQLSGCPGAAVAIVIDDQIVLLKGYGTRKYGSSDTVNAETIFRIGSLSKGFAGLLTSKMVEEGHLSWDDRVKDILPEFDLKDHAQAERINIKHLMSHSTGLQRHAYTNLTEAGLSVNQIVPEFSKLKVYGKEGDYYAYQNTAFAMIEEIIRLQTCDNFNDLLVEKIFIPAKMEQASTTYQDITGSENVALPHMINHGKRCTPVKLNRKYYNAVSAGGVNASIKDMAGWLQILLGNRPDIIAHENLEFIFNPVVKNPDRRSFYGWGNVESNYYGIGWRIVNWPDHSIIYHGGSVNGYRSEIAIDRENRIGICVLFNSNNHDANRIIPEFFRSYYSHLEKMNTSNKLMTRIENEIQKRRS